MSTYEYDQPTWQAYLQSINDALAALPATASPAASDLLTDMMNAAGAPLPPTTLQGAGNGMSFNWRELAPSAELQGGGFEIYGEQCADTDGMAAVKAVAGDFADYREIATQEKERRDARIAELEADVAAWQDRLARESRGWLTRVQQLEAERDALRTELAQRMAIPARALRSYG